MKATEMFEKLGYKKVNRFVDKISYERETPKGDIESIDFPLNQGNPKHFAVFFNGCFTDISVDELPAINQQIKELGWLDER